MPVWIKPPGIPRVNPNHPLAKDLILCVVPEYGELLTGTPPIPTDTNGAIGAGELGPATTHSQAGGNSTGGVRYDLPSWAPLYGIGTSWSAFMVAAITNVGSNFRALVGVAYQSNGDNPYYGWSPFNAYGDTAQGVWITSGGGILYYNGWSAWYSTDGAPHSYYVESDASGNLVCDRDGTQYSTGSYTVSTAPQIATNTQPLYLGCLTTLQLTPQAIASTIYLVLAFNRRLSATERVMLAQDPLALLDYQDDFGETTWYLPVGGAPPFDPSTSLVAQAPNIEPRRGGIRPSLLGGYFAPPVIVDRGVPLLPNIYPDTVRRPSLAPAQQPYRARAPSPERTVPYAEAISPSSVRRPVLPVSEQQPTTTVPPYVDRNFPITTVVAPDRITRPGTLASEQMVSPIREWVIEVPLPEPCVVAPSRLPRLPVPSLPFADPTYGWGLAPPSPTLAWNGEFPDSVRRPAMPVSEQQAHAEPVLPDPRTVPWSGVTAPDSVRRPRMRAALQQASALQPQPDARKVPWSGTTAPDRVARPTLPVASEPWFADPTDGWELVTPAPLLSWRGTWPDSVRRPMMPVSEQQAHALPPKPERIAAIATAVHPDRLTRLMLLVSEQQASPPVPLDRNSVLVAVVAPDRTVRAWMPVSLQMASAGLGEPITPPSAPDIVAAYYPSGTRLVYAAPMVYFFAPTSQARGPVPPSSVRIHGVVGDERLTRGLTGDTVNIKDKDKASDE